MHYFNEQDPQTFLSVIPADCEICVKITAILQLLKQESMHQIYHGSQRVNEFQSTFFVRYSGEMFEDEMFGHTRE